MTFLGTEESLTEISTYLEKSSKNIHQFSELLQKLSSSSSCVKKCDFYLKYIIIRSLTQKGICYGQICLAVTGRLTLHVEEHFLIVIGY